MKKRLNFFQNVIRKVILKIVSRIQDLRKRMIIPIRGSSNTTLITLLTLSGDETPLESESRSSVSGLNNSRLNNRGNGFANDSCLPNGAAEALRTNGKAGEEDEVRIIARLVAPRRQNSISNLQFTNTNIRLE